MPTSHTSKSINLATEDERDVVHQDIANDAATSSSHSSHRDCYPIGMPECKCLFEANHIEERKTDGIEDEPSIVVVDDVLAEHSYSQNGQGTTDEIAAIRHPKRIDAQHEVANRAAANSSCHTHNPSAEDVEMLGRGKTNARDCKGKSADELNNDERDRQPQRIAHVLQKFQEHN